MVDILNKSQHAAPEVKKAHSLLGWVRKSIASRLRELALKLYTALATPPMYCDQFWAP